MFAYVVLYGWPLVVAVLFRLYQLPLALAVAVVSGYLLLPPLQLDLPMLPALGRSTIPALVAFFAVLIIVKTPHPRVLPGWLPRKPVPRIIVLILIASPAMTALTNSEPYILPGLILPGLRPWDIISMVGAVSLSALPLLLGRKLLAFPEEQRTLLIVMAIGGALFCFLALFEIRMSPQLNRIIYGFDAHSWVAAWRGGSFRPVVFFVNGLILAMFLSMATLAAVGMIRAAEPRQKLFYVFLALWLLGTLLLTRSWGAIGITVLLAPMILFLARSQLLLVAAICSGIVILYPMLRGADLIPIDRVVEWAQDINPTRAHSLQYRVDNEDQLLDRASEKPLFGWGMWGRNHIYSDAGDRLSVTDGYWIGTIGVGGWVRYVAEFGLLCLPAIFAFFNRRRKELGLESVLLLMILAANLIDLLPNAALGAITWLIAGAIWGRLETVEVGATQSATIPAQDTTRTPTRRGVLAQGRADDGLRYTRQTTQHAPGPRAGPVASRDPGRGPKTSR